MNASRLLMIALIGLMAYPAEAGRRARPRGHSHGHAFVHAPAVRVYVGPWAPSYAPAARAGWVWVPGNYVGVRWYPGYWRPAVARLGWLWVAGYWDGGVYVDGYWREEGRSGQTWVDGYYDDDDRWVPGYWAPANSQDARRDSAVSAPPNDEVTVPDAPPPEPPSTGGTVYHDYD